MLLATTTFNSTSSTNKIETALEHGFCLKEGQTWVDSYEKEYLVA